MAMHTELLLLLLSISLTFLCSLTTKCTPLLVDARDFIIATWRVDEENKNAWKARRKFLINSMHFAVAAREHVKKIK